MTTSQPEPSVNVTPDLLRRLDALEAEGAVRRIMAECLEAGDANDGARVAALFTADGVWEAVGPLAALLGTHTGTDAIARRYSADVHPMSFSRHFLTNEAITVNGDRAAGAWRFLQAATIQGQALWGSGAYRADFVRVEGHWKIKHLRIENFFATPYEDGWAKIPFPRPPDGTQTTRR
jgi:hypothetical protein